MECLVSHIGFEPTQSHDNRVTACPNSPTLAVTHACWMVPPNTFEPFLYFAGFGSTSGASTTSLSHCCAACQVSRLSSFCSVLAACQALALAKTNATIEICETKATELIQPVIAAAIQRIIQKTTSPKCTHFNPFPFMCLL